MEKPTDSTQISLRPLDLSDVDDFMVWATDEKVAKFCSWEPYTNQEDGIKFINRIPSNFLWYRAICLNNQAIGAISLYSHAGCDKFRAKSAELGYVLGSKYWGKGIATRAVELVVDSVLGEFPYLERIEALVDVENLGSQRVLEKAGFQKEGVLRKYLYMKGRSRDMVIFSLLSSDIQA